MAEAIEGNGGWIVTEQDDKGRPLYVGKDNYWTRVKQAASPWKVQSEALEAADTINDSREQG